MWVMCTSHVYAGITENFYYDLCNASSLEERLPIAFTYINTIRRDIFGLERQDADIQMSLNGENCVGQTQLDAHWIPHKGTWVVYPTTIVNFNRRCLEYVPASFVFTVYHELGHCKQYKHLKNVCKIRMNNAYNTQVRRMHRVADYLCAHGAPVCHNDDVPDNSINPKEWDADTYAIRYMDDLPLIMHLLKNNAFPSRPSSYADNHTLYRAMHKEHIRRRIAKIYKKKQRKQQEGQRGEQHTARNWSKQLHVPRVVKNKRYRS